MSYMKVIAVFLVATVFLEMSPALAGCATSCGEAAPLLVAVAAAVGLALLVGLVAVVGLAAAVVGLTAGLVAVAGAAAVEQSDRRLDVPDWDGVLDYYTAGEPA